jgi:hypothetical protein
LLKTGRKKPEDFQEMQALVPPVSKRGRVRFLGFNRSRPTWTMAGGGHAMQFKLSTEGTDRLGLAEICRSFADQQ